jgi:demethylmenaquinone methyltransferase/2-methoxy-6-polyprenyl-1,4-benzoquinol methylase
MQSEDITNPAANILPDARSNLSKKAQVADMFNDIAGRYDFLNHLLSLGIDKGWRKKAIASIKKITPKTILDVATGTGDLAIEAVSLDPTIVVGIDIAEQMLDEGRKKLETLDLQSVISLQTGDSEAMSFADNSFDAITCAFGVRNFEHLEKGLKEMNRVMRIGGRIAIIEFSQPKIFPIKQIYYLYFRYVLPVLGKIFSKHSRAYTYLPESVMAFPEGNVFCSIMESCGFKETQVHRLTFGIASLYTATK